MDPIAGWLLSQGIDPVALGGALALTMLAVLLYGAATSFGQAK